MSDDMTYEQFERADADYDADTFGLAPGIAGVYMEHHADVFCKTCAKDILGEDLFRQLKEDDLGYDHPKADELGNVAAVLSTEEWDCPGANCGHCGISLDIQVIHYEGVCQVDTCPLSTECSTCGDPLYPDDKAVEIAKPTEGSDATSIVCTDCAKKAGVDAGAFGRTTRSLLGGY